MRAKVLHDLKWTGLHCSLQRIQSNEQENETVEIQSYDIPTDKYYIILKQCSFLGQKGTTAIL